MKDYVRQLQDVLMSIMTRVADCRDGLLCAIISGEFLETYQTLENFKTRYLDMIVLSRSDKEAVEDLMASAKQMLDFVLSRSRFLSDEYYKKEFVK